MTPAPIHITSTPTVTTVSGNSVVVSWEVANGSGQTATHRVSVLAADGTEVASGETQSGDGAVSIQIDGLTPGYGYRYVVTSKINDDPGWSETVGNEGDPLTFTIAFTVSNVAVNSDYTWVEGDTVHVCLNWQVEPAGVTSSHAVFRGDDTWVATGTEASDGSGWVTALFDLARGGRWPVWVQSAAVTANKGAPLIVDGLPLVTISDLLAVPLTPTNAVVSWSVDSHGAGISNVVSYWSGANPINTVTGDFLNGVVVATLTNLAANTSYDFFALSDSGLDANTTAGAFATLYGNFVSKAWVRITNVPTRGVVDTATRSTTLSWGIENNSGQNIHNTVAYSWTTGTDSGEGTATSDTVFGESVATVTIPNLIAGATYTFTASSSVVGHEGDAVYSSSIPSSSFTVTTQELPASIISIANVVTEFASDTAALVTWSAAKTNATDWAYHYVAYSTNSVMTATNTFVAEGFEFADTPGQVMAILGGLTPGEDYSFFVQSVIDGAPGHYVTADNQGANFTFTTDVPADPAAVVADSTPFIQITNSPTSFVSDTMALITWGVSNAFPIPGTHYVIWRNASPAATDYNVNKMVVASGLDDSEGNAAVLLTGLTPGSTNYYLVQSSVELGGDCFSDSDNNAGLYYWFVTTAGDSSSSTASGTGGSGSGTGTDGSASGSGSGSSDGSSSGTGSGDGSGTSSSGSGNGSSTSETSSSGDASGSVADPSSQTVSLTILFGFSIRGYTDVATSAGAKLTLSGPGMEPSTRELNVVFEDYSTTYTDEETGETITNPDWRAFLDTSVMWNADLIPGEKYTLKCEWLQKPSFANSIDCRVCAGVNLSSTNFLWPSSGTWKSFGMDRFYIDGMEIADSDGMDGTSNIWTITAPKVEIAVDANRDGQIKFDGTDNTSADNPFRFWIDNDYDSTVFGEDEDGKYVASEGEFVDEVVSKAAGIHPDFKYGKLFSKRQLEDMFKVVVSIKGIDGPIDEQGVSAEFYMQSLDQSKDPPGVLLYVSSDRNSVTDCLSSDIIASTQVDGTYPLGDGNARYGTTIGGSLISGGGRYCLGQINDLGVWFGGREIMDAMPHGDSKWHFLVNGCAAGRGKLGFRIYTSYSATEASLYVDLKDVKQMYVRAVASETSTIDNQADNKVAQVPIPVTDNTAADQPGVIGAKFEQPSNESNDYVVFVHGINNKTNDYTSISETMFKRLWWQGFKGRFVAFRWPCLMLGYSEGNTFNSSELRAYRCGSALSTYVNNNRAERSVSLVAHSQGNAVVAGAFRSGLQVQNYVLLQAAMPAGCYDTSANVNSYGLLVNRDRKPGMWTPNGQPWGYKGLLSSILGTCVHGETYNFVNTNDFALATGEEWYGLDTNWEANQYTMKPNWIQGIDRSRWYTYLPPSVLPVDNPVTMWKEIEVKEEISPGPTPQARYRLAKTPKPVGDPDEAHAYVARSRSKAAGATTAIALNIMKTVEMKYRDNNNQMTPFGGDRSDHSGQFYRRIQQVWDVYKQLFQAVKPDANP